MSTLTVFLYALVVVVSLLLIGIILIQPSKSGGMGAAFGGVGDSEACEKLVAPHSEVIGGVLLLGERVARLAEGRDVGERVGPPGVGQRAVEIEQKKADFRIFHFSVCYSVEGVYRL